MALPLPVYISDSQIVTNTIRYIWDEWNVNDYFISLDEDQFERLSSLSDAANLALAIGCAEWICHRFSTVSNDPVPYYFIEAAWAAIIHPAYCIDIETNDDEWRGPVRGPLNIMISILHDGIHRRDTDPIEATRVCWMYNLAQHILPNTDDFARWFESCVFRMEALHPWIEDNDIWEERAPLGSPVPREAIDPGYPYDPKDAPSFLDRFLRSLDPSTNPFMGKVDALLKVPNFKGIPYQYSASD